jgi:hypothetical protein
MDLASSATECLKSISLEIILFSNSILKMTITLFKYYST